MATANDTAGTMMTRADVIEYCLGFNQAFEDIECEHADLCVIDAFPGVDVEEIVKRAEEMADNVVVI